MHVSAKVGSYLLAKGVAGPWRLEGCQERGFSGAVVIPSLAEASSLFTTLDSLSANASMLLERFLVVVVVNHRHDASSEDKADNLQTLLRLAEYAVNTPLRLAWVDAASGGMELPDRKGGVGMARKIGFDLALSRLHPDRDGVLVALDADTIVRADYLKAIDLHFTKSTDGGAVVPFIHQDGESIAHSEAIRRYELYLRHYILGLSLAGSPYAFHTVGSAMACTASAYCRMGGMNCRTAAEDFYFLQQLHKTSGVSQVKGTTVFPSARSSHRVPFGTGKSVARHLAGDGATTFYRVECFLALQRFLTCVSNQDTIDGQAFLAEVFTISPALGQFLQEHDAVQVLQGLRRNHPTKKRFLAAFHCWFDALKTMKLIHHLSADLGRCEPEEALPPLFSWGNLSMDGGSETRLETLRRLQN